jgi:hypothetical protein
MDEHERDCEDEGKEEADHGLCRNILVLVYVSYENGKTWRLCLRLESCLVPSTTMGKYIGDKLTQIVPQNTTGHHPR